MRSLGLLYELLYDRLDDMVGLVYELLYETLDEISGLSYKLWYELLDAILYAISGLSDELFVDILKETFDDILCILNELSGALFV